MFPPDHSNSLEKVQCLHCKLLLDYCACPRELLLDSAELQPEKSGNLVGEILDHKYRILEAVGHGGMGAVYRAEHMALHKFVAIKVLNNELSSYTTGVSQFLDEAKLASSLSHPNLVSVTDYGLLPSGVPYFVQEYLEGVSLSNALGTDTCSSLKAIFQIALQIVDGVRFAHSLGIVHRDLKPSNVILVRRAGETAVKILDFGIAKKFSTDSIAFDVGGVTTKLGSPAYMSPEQWKNEKPDPRSDVYSFGCLFFELIYGAPPFFGNGLQLMFQHVEEPVKLPETTLLWRVPPGLRALIGKCLSKSPLDRYQTMDELYADLSRLNLELFGVGPKPLSERLKQKRAISILSVATLALCCSLAFILFHFRQIWEKQQSELAIQQRELSLQKEKLRRQESVLTSDKQSRLRSKVLAQRALILENTGQYAKAAIELKALYNLCKSHPEATPAFLLAILDHLIYCLGRSHQYGEAKLYYQIGEQYFDKCKIENVGVLRMFLNHYASIALNERHYPLAVSTAEHGLALKDGREASNLITCDLLLTKGEAYRNLHKYALAREALNEGAAMAERAFGEGKIKAEFLKKLALLEITQAP